MKREEFVKRSFKAFQEIEYHDPRAKNIDGELGVIVPCVILAVDYVEEIITLEIIPNDMYHIQNKFNASIKNCFLPKKEPKPHLKIVKQP